MRDSCFSSRTLRINFFNRREIQECFFADYMSSAEGAKNFGLESFKKSLG